MLFLVSAILARYTLLGRSLCDLPPFSFLPFENKKSSRIAYSSCNNQLVSTVSSVLLISSKGCTDRVVIDKFTSLYIFGYICVQQIEFHNIFKNHENHRWGVKLQVNVTKIKQRFMWWNIKRSVSHPFHESISRCSSPSVDKLCSEKKRMHEPNKEEQVAKGRESIRRFGLVHAQLDSQKRPWNELPTFSSFDCTFSG